jgi:hypothetical protein
MRSLPPLFSLTLAALAFLGLVFLFQVTIDDAPKHLVHVHSTRPVGRAKQTCTWTIAYFPCVGAGVVGAGDAGIGAGEPGGVAGCVAPGAAGSGFC